MKSFKTWGTKAVALALILSMALPMTSWAAGSPPRFPLDNPNDPGPQQELTGDPADAGGTKPSLVDSGTLGLVTICLRTWAAMMLNHCTPVPPPKLVLSIRRDRKR